MFNTKVRVINRDEQEFTRQRGEDKYKVHRNLDPVLHPHQKAREYTRALNAVKLERMFAKPFLTSFEGHTDGIYALSSVPTNLTHVLSGDGVGELRCWHIGTHKTLWSANAHRGRITGIAVDPFGDLAITAGIDQTIKVWNVNHEVDSSSSILGSDGSHERKTAIAEPINVFVGENSFLGIDHHKSRTEFATCGVRVDLWDHTRADPVHSFKWGADTVNCVRFNPIDTDILVSCANDRSIVLYDIRQKTPLKKLLLNMCSNDIAWNPMESFSFVVANDDHNLYSFDMRNLARATCVHEDHAMAVMCVSYAPTGKEFVSGSYDKSVRIFGANAPHSREIYHTKRMQKVFSVCFSSDNRYILSGSDDTNIRLWKARASEKLEILTQREKQSLEHADKLKEKFAYMPEISKIAKKRQTPSIIYKIQKKKRIMKAAQERRLKNVRRHAKVSGQPIPEHLAKTRNESAIRKIVE